MNISENNNLNTGKKKQLIIFRDISIWLDTYDDIFSDFDPRPYSERTFSDDFLAEVRKVCREKEEKVHELKLLIPANKRSQNDEIIITKRLHNYFKKNQQHYKEQYQALWRRGSFFTITGMLMMMAASYLSSLRSGVIFINLLLVISEPSGWFLVWTGFDTILSVSKQNKKEREFYNKIVKSKISFLSI